MCRPNQIRPDFLPLKYAVLSVWMFKRFAGNEHLFRFLMNLILILWLFECLEKRRLLFRIWYRVVFVKLKGEVWKKSVYIECPDSHLMYKNWRKHSRRVSLSSVFPFLLIYWSDWQIHTKPTYWWKRWTFMRWPDSWSYIWENYRNRCSLTRCTKNFSKPSVSLPFVYIFYSWFWMNWFNNCFVLRYDKSIGKE